MDNDQANEMLDLLDGIRTLLISINDKLNTTNLDNIEAAISDVNSYLHSIDSGISSVDHNTR